MEKEFPFQNGILGKFPLNLSFQKAILQYEIWENSIFEIFLFKMKFVNLKRNYKNLGIIPLKLRSNNVNIYIYIIGID